MRYQIGESTGWNQDCQEKYQNHRYMDDTTIMEEGEEELKNILMKVKEESCPGSMHDTGCLGLVHWETQRDGMGREEGGGFRVGNTCIPVADSF